ncbi:hypothetical protein ACYOEI_00830 [Singulisphaera rosea]
MNSFAQSESGLSLADLAEYRTALIDRGESKPVAVSFTELWNHPESYRGRRVEVVGKVARTFHQGAIGTFPPLVELFAVTPSGNPYTLVYPTEAGGSNPAPTAANVRFVGTYIRTITYQAGDGPRLVPLIVGAHPPNPIRIEASAETKSSISQMDLFVGLAGALVVAIILARQHLKRPVPRSFDGLHNVPSDWTHGSLEDLQTPEKAQIDSRTEAERLEE